MDAFVEAVEALEKDGGIAKPASSERLLGKWRLLFTTSPGTQSPIQRTFIGVDAFKIFQVIEDDGDILRIANMVEFGEKIGKLNVEAKVSTQSKPLPNFTPRQGAGNPLFGKSFNTPPPREDCRLNIQFDQAAFDFNFLPFKIPYPVPFRFLGDESKAWFDVTYLSQSGDFRLTRGNKGTLFVLAKEA